MTIDNNDNKIQELYMFVRKIVVIYSMLNVILFSSFMNNKNIDLIHEQFPCFKLT